jgi:hypothetical protein
MKYLPSILSAFRTSAGSLTGEPSPTNAANLTAMIAKLQVKILLTLYPLIMLYRTENREGRPLRGEDSTTYVGAIETAEEFGRRLYSAARYRGWARAEKKVVVGDSPGH